MSWRLFETNNTSDLTGGFANRDLAIMPVGSTTQALSVPGSSTREIWFFTKASDPDNGDWKDGDFSHKCRITSGSSFIQISSRIARVNSAGTIQEQGAATAEQTGSTGTLTFTHTGLTWTAGAASDRLLVKLICRNTAGTSKSITFGLGASTDYVDSPFEDLGLSQLALMGVA